MTSARASFGTRSPAWLLGVSLSLLVSGPIGCKDELEGKVADDPLEDPWVSALETGGDEDAVADPSEATTPAPASLAGTPTEAAAGSLALAQPSVPDGSVAGEDGAPEPSLASPPPAEHGSTGSGSPSDGPSASPGSTPPAPGQPEPGQPEPSQPEPSPAQPAPAAAPQPAPTSAPAEPASPPPLTLADFDGRYRYVGGSAQVAARDAAVEVTVNALASALRGIARRRLTATNPIENTVEIVVAGDKVTTTFESGVTATCVIDGGTVDARDIEGGKTRIRARWQNGKLVQQMEGKGGARTTVYTLSSDRKKLTVHNKITSPRLPEPLVYKLSFSRK